MADHSKIEWTDTTLNPTTGCTQISPGCDNCYAKRIVERFKGKGAFDTVTRDESKLFVPFKWRTPRRVFVNSMSDVFHDQIPDAFIANLWSVMARTPKHTYQILTKRHGRMLSLLSRASFRDNLLDLVPDARWPLPNLWLGVSVEDQKRADLRIPALRYTPAAVRWVSCEPLLGEVDLVKATHHPLTPSYAHWPGCDCGRIDGIDWVVAGGESGPGARPAHPAWFRSLRDQCVSAGVPFFFKQWGEHLPVPVEDDPTFAGGRAFNHPQGGRVSATLRERGKPFHPGATRLMRAGDRNGHGVMLDDNTLAVRVGKHAAGRELDGHTWDEYPQAVA